MKQLLDRLKRYCGMIVRSEPLIRREINVPLMVHGSDYGAFAVCPRNLPQGCIVYSAGVGEDISFDLSMIETHRAVVHAFDPTPRSCEWLAQQSLPPEFHHYPWAISNRDGPIELYPPLHPSHVSHSVVRSHSESGGTLTAPARRLSTIAAELRHDRIDVLKLDIEGAEYDVLQDVMDSGLDVAQIAVEFHHRWVEVMPGSTERILSTLHEAGYRIFFISPRGHEVSLLRVR